MLYNKDWDQKPEVSLADFIGWLETKDPDRKYDFTCNKGECLVGQYMAARGIEWNLQERGNNYALTVNKLFGDHIGSVGFYCPVGEGERDVLATGVKTFGAALKRAKAFAHNHPEMMEKARENVNA